MNKLVAAAEHIYILSPWREWQSDPCLEIKGHFSALKQSNETLKQC